MLLDEKNTNDSVEKFEEDIVDEKDKQIQAQKQFIGQLEIKLNEVERLLEKEKELTKLLSSKLRQYEIEEKIANKKKDIESFIPPSFELDSQDFEIHDIEPRRSQRLKKISPPSMVKRVKSKKRKPKSDPQFQYEVVFNKKKTENLASKKAEETDDKSAEKIMDSNEEYVGQHAEEDNKIAENDIKNDEDDEEVEMSGGEEELFTENDIEVEEDDEENGVDGNEEQISESIEEAEEDECKEEDKDEVEESEDEVESSSTGIESSKYNSEKEEAKVVDLDKYSPRHTEYCQRNISKSHILLKLESQKRDAVRAFFLCSDKTK